MGKITKTMQQKHKDTLSPWLQKWVQAAVEVPLPRLPDYLGQFPMPWELPRDDLYHWIPLLNRFDAVLEAFCSEYKLDDGPQLRDFAYDVLLKSDPVEGQPWDYAKLEALGYGRDGDKSLLISVLNFSRTLLENCGNRSIYSSSIHLSNILQSADLEVLAATLEVGLELAKRYQASVRRINMPTRPPASLLGSHYNIELDRVQLLASPFSKTPLAQRLEDSPAPTQTPSSSKGKEKATSLAAAAAARQPAVTYLNDIASTLKSDSVTGTTSPWSSWADIKVNYSTPETPAASSTAGPAPPATPAAPSTPTPLRRSATVGSAQPSSRGNRSSGSDAAVSPSSSRPLGTPRGEHGAGSGMKRVEVSWTLVAKMSLYDLLEKAPQDMPKAARYEYLNRLRIAKALIGSTERRQQVLAVRLLAIANLAYIYPETTFVEKVMRQDNDEPRHNQIIYQLVELVQPSTTGSLLTPLWLQTISLSLLEAIASFASKYHDVSNALNATATHGVLLYLLRKAVAQMKEEDKSDPRGEKEQWRKALFSLTQAITMARASPESVTPGLLELLIEILNMRSDLAERTFQSILHFIDNVLSSFQGSFQYFCNVQGLDALTKLFIHEVAFSAKLAQSGQGTKPDLRSSVMDYEIPYHQQHNLKWLLKFVHHALTNSYMFGGNNTERLLRNLAENSALLHSVRDIMENMARFGSVVWTASITILSDFLNNDPASAGAILESGLIKTFLQSVTGNQSTDWVAAPEQARAEQQDADHADDASDASSEAASVLGNALLTRPPERDATWLARSHPLAGSIHPTAEAITSIPNVLNSISLSRIGMKMVVDSKALTHYFEIFENPEHVRLLTTDTAEYATIIGGSMDELARHHPQLRPTIANAVIETLSRIVYLGISKADTDGWGTKLVLTNPDGEVVTADERCLFQKSDKAAASASSTDNSNDVEMIDAGISGTSELAPATKKPSTSGPEHEITPYILTISTFLNTYITNSGLRDHFVQQGGIELLLDLSQSPSLPPSFMDSQAARRLQMLFSQLMESHAIVGMPSLLNRTVRVLDTLAPLAQNAGNALYDPFEESDDNYPFFTPFLIRTAEQPADMSCAANGTEVARGLLHIQSLLKTLYHCFPYSNRHGTIGLHPVNVYDYYTELTQKLGPLLRVVLAEEMSLSIIVPRNWVNTKGVPETSNSTSSSRLPDLPLPDANGRAPEGATASGSVNTSDVPRKITEEDQSSHAFLNFQTLQPLLHELMPTAFPFFQNLGKALFPRRTAGDGYFKEKYWGVADALSCAVLNHLEVSGEAQEQRDFHYWIIMLHAVSEMLVDSGRAMDRVDRILVIIPVLLAFKEHGGLEKLNSMLRIFMKELAKEDKTDDAQPSMLKKLAAMGTRKILDLYCIILNGRHIGDSVNQCSLVTSRQQEGRHSLPSQLLLEIRLSVWPVVVELWQSPILETGPIDILSKVTEILRTVASPDEELGGARLPGERSSLHQLLKRTPQSFNWEATAANTVRTLISDGYDEDLSREAVYRSYSDYNKASEYCRAHSKNTAGARNPVPESDAYQPPEPVQPSRSSTPVLSAMPVDGSLASGDNGVDTAMEDESEGERDGEGDGEAPTGTQNPEEGNESQADETSDSGSAGSSTDVSHTGPVAGGVAGSANAVVNLGAALDATTQVGDVESAVVATKEQMDKMRQSLRKDLIERCLDVLRAHPTAAHDIADLINGMMPKEFDNERQDVGETLTNALLSFAVDDEYKKENGGSIAAIAHLLSLLLSNDLNPSQSFLENTTQTLVDNISEFLGFLKLGPSASKEELPPWIPYVLLIFEIVLKEDETPPKFKWTGPAKEDDPVEEPVLEMVKERIVKNADRAVLLEAVLDLLPRIGREEGLAVAALRILVILTRNRSIATAVGNKKNLGRLFVMAKQLSSMGSERLNNLRVTAHIMTVLRHIVEDEETIKQIMRSDIKAAFDAQRHRSLEMVSLARALYSTVLRSPELFVEVANGMLKLDKWYPPSSNSRNSVSLKVPINVAGEPIKNKPEESTTAPAPATAEADGAVTVEAGSKASDSVKQTTEDMDKEMTEAPKPTSPEVKRPVLENPDGVVHFLLCELFNYREVEDKEEKPVSGTSSSLEVSLDAPQATGTNTVTATTTATFTATAAPTPAAPGVSSEGSSKDKKLSKPSFKPDDHPIFIYRAFLLNCLAELVQSYTRAKVEFINFKRSAPLLNNTPVKPRSSVLNYLLNDVVCNNSVFSIPTPDVTTATKKKLLTANAAQDLLVALVSRTPERRVDRTRDRYDYDDEPDLLFVQKFVLDTVLKAYKEASTSSEAFEPRYTRMLCLAELMNLMIGGDKEPSRHPVDSATERSHVQLKRLMYEKGYVTALTHSIADIDLAIPTVKRTIKYILRVLHSLTQTAILLSHSNIIPASASEEDEIASATSLSEIEVDREETPDLYRNSSLGMNELGGGEDEFSGGSQDEDDDMYEDEYGDNMEYGDEISGDDDENVSDEDEELGDIDQNMGNAGDDLIEVLMHDNEIMMHDNDDEDGDDGEDDDQDDDDDMDDDDDDAHSEGHHLEIVDEEGNPLEDDGASGWESDSDGHDDEDEDQVDYEAETQDQDEADDFQNMLHMEGDEFAGDVGAFNDGYLDEDVDEDEEEDDEEQDDDEYVYDEDYSHDIHPPNIPASLGWDTLVVEHPGGHQFHPFGHHPRRHVGRVVATRYGAPDGGHPHPHSQPSASSQFLGMLGDMEQRITRLIDGLDIRWGARPTGVAPDEGVNPLLRRRTVPPAAASSSRGAFPPIYRSMIPPPAFNPSDNPVAVLQNILDSLPAGSLQVSISHGPRGEIRAIGSPHIREVRTTETRRTETYQEPQQAVNFGTVSMATRWLEEARMVFGSLNVVYNAKVDRVVPLILAKLTPAAIEIERKARKEEEERRKKEDEARKKREEEERVVREKKEAEEKAAREKKEAEEREKAEREAAEAAARAAEQEEEAAAAAAAASTTSVSSTGATLGTEEGQPMEGVETTTTAPSDAQATSRPQQPRVMATIRGEQVDITDLGIDLEYLEALPDEFREEVIAQAVTTRRSEARDNAQTSGEQPEVFQEFLDALPDDLRQEILHQERNEQRRRATNGQARNTTGAGGPSAVEAAAQEMDAASILLTFPPELRQEVLMAQGHELLDQLPPDMAAEVRALAGVPTARRTPPAPRIGGIGQIATRHRGLPVGAPPERKEPGQKRMTVVQMLDAAGIATLLRLMFISQQSNIRSNLFDVFMNVCENSHSRLEVVRSVLQILQDGSTDMDAVERSFSQLSLRARQPREKEKEMKTPQSIKRSLTAGAPSHQHVLHHHHNADVSPLVIVQQCLDLLVTLCSKNARTAPLFLSEHDYSSTSLKRTLSKKGKGKDAPKAQKYAINFLLGLLDREIVMGSAHVLQLLSGLLDIITSPLATRERRRLQAQEAAVQAELMRETETGRAEVQAQGTTAETEVGTGTAQPGQEARVQTPALQGQGTVQGENEPSAAALIPAAGVPAAGVPAVSVPAAGVPAAGVPAVGVPVAAVSAVADAPTSAPAEVTTVSDVKREHEAGSSTSVTAPEKKAKEPPSLPAIPDHNLTLVVKIFGARECNARTFQTTISTIKNLSCIPGAKSVFGAELIAQANNLGESIVTDLKQLLPHIQKAKSGTEIQGLALSKFSPNTSDQNKLLRVLTALDHLFDSKSATTQAAAGDKQSPKGQDVLNPLYHNTTFRIMWDSLSGCLSAMHQRENMVNVATILLPLIEALMVVCKNVATDDSKSEVHPEMVISSPAPESESPILSLFFSFTEEHRRILNDLVRSSPKLMSGTFSLLVKNPKVLDFDNKRNWFNRSVHQRSQTRNTFPTLQLSVRRDHVFHDSFRSLYYKTGDEMKYGKLNIRFHGEEGVDAGGVTREWFQVLARQMFDPNYALFTPVSSDRTTFHPNKLSAINDEHLLFFKFIGRIIGKALYENRLLDCYFSRAVYKRILGKQVSVKDMESFDPDYYKSLCWILENDITDIITETFSVEVDEFGLKTIQDLCENGRNIPVSEINKQDYVRLVVEHKLLSSVKEQMESFLQGFHDIIPADLIAIFNEQELELLISGLPDVDIDDWKANTEYHNYPQTAPQIQWFWRAVRSFDKEERAKLLQFVTGTSKVPLNGFKDLEGMNGVSRFNIHRDYGSKDRLPSSHTCFNQLDLPEYESYDILRTQVHKAITAGNEYFGFA